MSDILHDHTTTFTVDPYQKALPADTRQAGLEIGDAIDAARK